MTHMLRDKRVDCYNCGKTITVRRLFSARISGTPDTKEEMVAVLEVKDYLVKNAEYV